MPIDHHSKRQYNWLRYHSFFVAAHFINLYGGALNIMSSILSRLRIAWFLPVLLVALGLGVQSVAARSSAGPSDPDSHAACAGEQFSDVCPGDWFSDYVTGLAALGAISGYGDGTFRPNNTITRGQAMKVIV